jgi:hypothetical protein
MLKGQKQGEANVHTRAMQAVIGMVPADPHEPAITWRTLWQAFNDGFQSNTAATGGLAFGACEGTASTALFNYMICVGFYAM